VYVRLKILLFLLAEICKETSQSFKREQQATDVDIILFSTKLHCNCFVHDSSS
jgi:hypothetical protein